MGIPEGMYPEFKKLSKWVIKDPLAEINRVTDLTATAEYQKEGKAVIAVKFRIRRTLQLPESQSAQKELFPEQEDAPAVVQDLIAAGLSREDALDIWQHGVAYVEAGSRPAPEAFGTYIREKIHLLKRRQASGKIEYSTGFLLDAIKKNYPNPEFTQEEQRKDAWAQQQTRQARARKLEALKGKKTDVENTLWRDIRARCQQVLTPELAEEAVSALLAEKPDLKRWYLPGKTALENYREATFLWTEVDGYLEQHYPERFADIRATYAPQLAALDEKIATLSHCLP